MPKKATILIGVLLIVFISISNPIKNENVHDLKEMKQRYIDMLLHSTISPNVCRRFQPALSKVFEDTGDKQRGQAGLRQPYNALTDLLRCVSDSYVDQQVGNTLKGRAHLVNSLSFWLEQDYHHENWWWNHIKAPTILGKLLLLLEGTLSPELEHLILKRMSGQRKKDDSYWHGSNQIRRLNIKLMRGLGTQNSVMVQKVFTKFEHMLLTEGENGIQTDFTFHMHGDALTSGSYGLVFATIGAKFLHVSHETKFEISHTAKQKFYKYVRHLQKLVVDKNTLDYLTMGRSITRKNPYKNQMATILTLLEGIHNGNSGASSHYYQVSDLYVHRSNDAYTSVRVLSSSMFNTDYPYNGEGLKSHHLADGANLIYVTGDEYDGIFPVWDWQRVPGVTAVQLPRLKGDVVKRGKKNHVFGVSNGHTGAVAMRERNHRLNAKKAWFFVGGFYVALGTEISSQESFPVLTSVNQSYGAQEWFIETNYPVKEVARGEQVSFHSPAKVWHQNIGYVFLPQNPVPIQGQIVKQTGSWSAINHQYQNKGRITKPVFSLWVNHGLKPKASSYGYAIFPSIKRESFFKVNQQSLVQVLVNERAKQAINIPHQNMMMAVFWSPGVIKRTDGDTIRVNTPCILIFKQIEDKVKVWVATNRKNSSSLTITYNGMTKTVSWQVSGSSGYKKVSVTFSR